MPPELKERLGREAEINGRSLNAEIVDRLRKSLETRPPLSLVGEGYQAQQPREGYDAITDIERQLLTIFRRLPVEKQLALLSLFK